MQDNIITWNLANWVSVVLMAMIGFALVGLVVTVARNKGIGSNSAQSQQSQQSQQAASLAS